MQKNVVKTYRDLNVYSQSYKLAVSIFDITKTFPKEEVFSLTQQMLKASRSIPANIGEGWAKRRYKNVFVRHLIDAIGSCDEIKIWLDFAKDFNYLSAEDYEQLNGGYNQVGAMLNSLVQNWRDFDKL
jgi:four helix bundle protein